MTRDGSFDGMASWDAASQTARVLLGNVGGISSTTVRLTGFTGTTASVRHWWSAGHSDQRLVDVGCIYDPVALTTSLRAPNTAGTLGLSRLVWKLLELLNPYVAWGWLA